MAVYVGTSNIVASGDAYSMADSTYVAIGVSLVSTGGNGVNAIGASPTLENHGQIVGLTGARLHQNGLTLINGQEGIISGIPGGTPSYAVDIDSPQGASVTNDGQISMPGLEGAALHASTGTTVINDGDITAGSEAILFDSTTSTDVYAVFNSGDIVGAYDAATTVAKETIVNHGTIHGAVFFGTGANDLLSNGATGHVVGPVDIGSGDNAVFRNDGGVGPVVFGNGNGGQMLNFARLEGNLAMGNGNSDLVVNQGLLLGNVTLGAGTGTIFDSTLGQVTGTVTAGSGGATIVGAVNGGSLMGSTGSDVLIANQTQDAVTTYHAMATMDGGGGTNALYGGGGINTFLAGDATYDQIWGGFSQTAGYAGYTNNTLSFASAGAGVFVDLLDGHDAYVALNAGTGWDGNGRYEDSIANVPNATGSSYGDVIQADNGTDRITGGGGADALYAGSGPQSQDTFVYTAHGDSNLVSGYDTIVGFKTGTDKIDLTAFHTDGSHLALSNAGTSNSVYLEQTAGSFNPNTDLAMVVNATTTGGLKASDFIF